MCSSSPARTPKLKLAVEQLLTKGCWNPPPKKKKIPHVQGQTRSHNKTVGGVQPQSNQITHLPGGRLTNWRTIKTNNFSHCYEGSRPYTRFPSLRILQRDWESPGNPRPVGFDYRTSTGQGKQRLYSWRAQTKP